MELRVELYVYRLAAPALFYTGLGGTAGDLGVGPGRPIWAVVRKSNAADSAFQLPSISFQHQHAYVSPCLDEKRAILLKRSSELSQFKNYSRKAVSVKTGYFELLWPVGLWVYMPLHPSP